MMVSFSCDIFRSHLNSNGRFTDVRIKFARTIELGHLSQWILPSQHRTGNRSAPSGFWTGGGRSGEGFLENVEGKTMKALKLVSSPAIHALWI
jgi:hypothetical protein